MLEFIFLLVITFVIFYNEVIAYNKLIFLEKIEDIYIYIYNGDKEIFPKTMLALFSKRHLSYI